MNGVFMVRCKIGLSDLLPHLVMSQIAGPCGESKAFLDVWQQMFPSWQLIMQEMWQTPSNIYHTHNSACGGTVNLDVYPR